MFEGKFRFDAVTYQHAREPRYQIDAQIAEEVWRWYLQGSDPRIYADRRITELFLTSALSQTSKYIRDQQLINPQEDTHSGHKDRVHIGLWLLEQGVISAASLAADMEKDKPEIWKNLAQLEPDHVTTLREMLENRTDEIAPLIRNQNASLTEPEPEGVQRDKYTTLVREIRQTVFPQSGRLIHGAIFALHVGLATRKIRYVRISENQSRLRLVQSPPEGTRRSRQT